jgi:hypothetical protein
MMLVAELIVLAIFLVVGVVALANGAGRGFALTPLYDSSTFSLGLVFGAVSIAVLSFLGFDGISTLAEENRESARTLGRSMIAALAVAGLLFVVQTWVAALLVPDPQRLIAEGDAGGHRVLRRRGGGGRGLAVHPDGGGHGGGVGVRQLARRAGGDVAPAVRDGPRPAAAVVPASCAPPAPRPGERDAARRRHLAGARHLHEHP